MPPNPPRGDRVALVIVALGALAVALVALPYKAFDLDRYFVPKELALFATALVAALAVLIGRKKLALTTVDVLITAFLLLSAASAVFAANWWVAARALGISLAGAALFWVGRAFATSGFTRAVATAIGVAVVAGAVSSLLQAYGVDSPYFSLSRSPGGTFGNRNFVAHVCAIGLPAVLYVTVTARRSGSALAGAVGMGIIAAALVLSRSRAAWLAVAVSIGPVAFVALALRSRWKGQGIGRRALTIAIVSSVAVLLAVFLPNTLEWKSESPYLDSVRGVVNYRQGSGRGRLVQYTNSLHITAAHPILGVGPGNWAVVYPRYASDNDPSLDSEGMTANPWPSSDLVAYLAERGAPAFAAIVLVFLVLIGTAARQIARAQTPNDLFRALALAGTVAATLVVGAFDAVLLLAAPTLIAWTLFGALAEPSARTRLTVSPGVREWAPALVVGAGMLAAGHAALQSAAMDLASRPRLSTLEQAARLDPGNYHVRVRLAQAQLSRGNCQRARVDARAAHDQFPSAPEPRRLLAACGERVRGH